MSWAYLLQINARLASRKQIKSHHITTAMRRHGTDTDQRGAFTLSGLDVWLKMQKKSDYWCDYWRVHESHLFTSGKDSILFFCLPFKSIMTFFLNMGAAFKSCWSCSHTGGPQVTELHVSSRALKEHTTAYCDDRKWPVNHTVILLHHTTCSENFYINRVVNLFGSCPWYISGCDVGYSCLWTKPAQDLWVWRKQPNTQLQTAGFEVMLLLCWEFHWHFYSWWRLFYFLCTAVKLQRGAAYDLLYHWWGSWLCPLPSATIAVFSCVSAVGGELCQCRVFVLEGIAIHHWMGLLPRCLSTALYSHLFFWPFF